MVGCGDKMLRYGRCCIGGGGRGAKFRDLGGALFGGWGGKILKYGRFSVGEGPKF